MNESISPEHFHFIFTVHSNGSKTKSDKVTESINNIYKSTLLTQHIPLSCVVFSLSIGLLLPAIRLPKENWTKFIVLFCFYNNLIVCLVFIHWHFGLIFCSLFLKGTEANMDSCCRTHDLCPVKIRAYESKYNITNDSLYTK